MRDQTDISPNNARLFKNTVLLYIRTIVVMFITLYTSRIVLRELGVIDYGIYNVVAGFVSMFSFISGALSLAISRFITFELGKGDEVAVQKVFSASLVVQLMLSLFVVLLGEVFGLWFLNEKMNIPDNRINAANWVYQLSLLAFCINLISVPYNALITAYERMRAFAYISILEASLKLAVCFILFISFIDKLLLYGLLLVLVSIIIRVIYGSYCHHMLPGSRFSFDVRKSDIISIGKFAGWTFFSNGAAVLNTQGINVLTNIFFNVGFNAARGIATQAESAIKQFVSSFTTSINPQIIKHYAAGNQAELFILICRGSKFSYFLFLLLALPLFFEADFVLKLWLINPPFKAAIFLKLAIACELINILGSSGTTACHATGKMKLYVLSITSLSILVFPLTYIAYSLGMDVEYSYYIFIAIYILIMFVRLIIMKKLIGFPISLFIHDVLLKVLLCTLMAIFVPYSITQMMDESLFRFVLVFMLCFIFNSIIILFLGLNFRERSVIFNFVKSKFRGYFEKCCKI